MTEGIDKAGYGPLEGQEYVVAYNATLGTTASEVTAQTRALVALLAYPNTQFWRLKIYNASAGATIAWATASPTDIAFASAITADFVPATAGSHIAPGQSEYYAMQGSKLGVFLRRLYLVASAAGTSASVTLSPIT